MWLCAQSTRSHYVGLLLAAAVFSSFSIFAQNARERKKKCAVIDVGTVAVMLCTEHGLGFRWISMQFICKMEETVNLTL